MADGKKFKVGMMGYSKKDVYAYINEMDDSYSKSLTELKRENAELKARLHALENENAELRQKSELITDAIVKAEEYSKELIDKAQQSAQELRDRIDAEMQVERDKRDAYRERVEALRVHLMDLMRDFDRKLEETDL